ncbi:meiosis protein SPO22/ZIP4 like-domain-containing protein [Corynascus novoguineensis]|uniref:Meiosis protein SPO22/ZIP4 like-domain-containing protein n=1 Tax=Corynascus novoguineensis TaxID=1126955 RepID=A0AAN7HD20_9PEZI|nr:meiosis protein SPO22/ZIP4 like-domain-containing protein [Corynascus novoguineensis]
MAAIESVEKTSGKEDQASSKSEGEAKSNDQRAPAADNAHRTQKKRRKERPCTRCIKRNIGHLCHDEPRDHESKRSKSLASSTAPDSGPQPDIGQSPLNQNAGTMRPPSFDSAMSNGPGQAAKAGFDAATLASRSSNPLQLVQPTPVSGIAASALGGMSQFPGFSDAWLASQNPYHDMHNFHSNYVIAPEVTNEFNLLNDFLQTSLLDDTALLGDDQNQADAASGFASSSSAMLPPSAVQGGSMPAPNAEQGKAISRPASVLPADKARAYYLQAADPTGNAPEERMRQVLQAKYEAGLLKPFNYVKGYTRLQNYLATHVSASSKQKILRQLDRFRPKFREKIKDLTDMDLVLVEMWFERTLMDYDRVFASMAVPACCWRRTGEIFRGNKEMAELIKVPVEDLRGGKIALHEILTEESNVRYWEEFGTIAFDPAHDTLLTACSLQSRDGGKPVNCCFSFRIRRDDHKIHSSQLASNSEKRIEAAVEFATRLRKILLSSKIPSTDSDQHDATLLADAPSLVQDIVTHVGRLHACQQTYVPGLNGDPEIDELATGLWNVCTRMGSALKEDDLEAGSREEHSSVKAGEWDGQRKSTEWVGRRLGRLYLHGRVLAFHLPGVARPGGNGRVAVILRLMKLGLKVMRDCLKLAGQVAQIATDYKEWLQSMAKILPEDEVRECQCLEVEYFIMRTAMCWVENRLDVAEHMYSKTDYLRPLLTPEYAERLADVLYEIGKSLSAKGDFKIAIKWFERANDIINGQKFEQFSHQGLELRLAIIQALVTALLAAGIPEGIEKAKNYIDFIEAKSGNKFVVSLLKLELLQNTPAKVFDSEAYADVLLYIIQNFSFSESAFILIIHHIRKLHDKSPEKDEWLEKAVVTRMWMITNQRDSLEAIGAIQGVLGCLRNPLSAEAAMAVQALLRKKLESNYSQGHYDMAESWCQLSLHSVFQNCGAGNISKLESVDAAASIVHNMSPQNRKEPMTAYLAFKVAIRIQDRALAEECLEIVAQAPDHVDYLGACIAESQKAGDIICAIAALMKLQENYEYKEPNPIHLPALFRCTIRLLNLLAERPGVDPDTVVNHLCEAFEAVLYATMRKIIDEIWVLERFDAVKMAKYTRCLFQATLPLDDGLALQLLDEACSKAKGLRETQATWPEEELEWMATTSFNRAIDCCSVHQAERAREWAAKAINLAHFCSDGKLVKILQNKRARLNLDGVSK